MMRLSPRIESSPPLPACPELVERVTPGEGTKILAYNPPRTIARGRTKGTDRMSTNAILQPGIPAPDFTLSSKPDEKLSLRKHRGQPVVLVFYPADFSPVCGDQVELYNEI